MGYCSLDYLSSSEIERDCILFIVETQEWIDAKFEGRLGVGPIAHKAYVFNSN